MSFQRSPTKGSKLPPNSKTCLPNPKLNKKMMNGCSRALRLFSGITVEPVLFLYMLATFSQYALFQDLVYSKVCWGEFSDEICKDLESPSSSSELEFVQASASFWILMSTISMVIPSILISIYMGSWSDKFGRKWPVVFPPLGGVLACVVYTVLAFKLKTPVAWICLASLLSGMSGGFVCCIMSCMTYVASVSSQDMRTTRISRLEAMIFLGGTVGPFLSGSMLQITGHGYAFIFMMACYAIASLYALIFVKEVHEDVSLSSNSNNTPNTNNRLPPDSTVDCPEQRTGLLSLALKGGNLDNLPDVARSATVVECERYHSHRSIESQSQSGHEHEDCSSTAASDDEQRNILRRRSEEIDSEIDPEGPSCCSRYFGGEHFISAVKTVFKNREGYRRRYLLLTIAAGYIGMMITAGELDVAYLFAKSDPLKWSHQTYSYYFGFKYGIGTLVLLIGMPLFQQFKVRDSTICILGLVSRMAGLVLYALSPDTTVAFIVPIVAMFSSFTIPATRSLLSKLVSPHEQGKMFSFVAIMEDLCTMTASLMFNSVYPLTRPILKGFIFLLAAAILIIPVLLMWFVGNRLSKLEEFSPTSSSSAENNASSQNKNKIKEYESSDVCQHQHQTDIEQGSR